MSEKTYCKKTAAFIGWIIQNIPGDLTETEMNIWMSRPTDTKQFLLGLHKPVAVQKIHNERMQQKRAPTVAEWNADLSDGLF